MKKTKIGAMFFALLLVTLLVTSGCTEKYNQEEVNVLIDNAVKPLENEKDLLKYEVSDLNKMLVGFQNQLDALKSELETKDSYVSELEAELEAQQEKVVEATYEGPQAEVIDDIKLGSAIVFSIDDSELDKLLDTEIEFDGNDYDVHEEFISLNSVVMAFNGYGYDEEFGANPYVVFANAESLIYKYVFDDKIELADISNEEPLEIEFLGKPLKIVKAGATELKVEYGIELLLNINKPYLYNDKELSLFGINNDEAFIGYNGDFKSIDEGQTKSVGGIDVKVIEAFESNIGNVGFVKVVIGSEVEKTLKDDDEYLEIEEFKFYIVVSGSKLSELKVVYDVKSDELDDEYAPLAIGDSVVFPNEYLVFEFSEISNVDYVDFEVYFDEFDAEDDLASDENGIVLEAGKAVIEIDNDEFEELYFLNSGIYYKNDEGEFTLASDSEALIVVNDFEYKVSFDGNYLIFKDAYNDELKIDVDLANLKLGSLEEDAEAGDVIYAGLNFGTLEYDLLLASGVIVSDVENNADNDEVKFKVPSKLVEATIKVY